MSQMNSDPAAAAAAATSTLYSYDNARFHTLRTALDQVAPARAGAIFDGWIQMNRGGPNKYVIAQLVKRALTASAVAFDTALAAFAALHPDDASEFRDYKFPVKSVTSATGEPLSAALLIGMRFEMAKELAANNRTGALEWQALIQFFYPVRDVAMPNTTYSDSNLASFKAELARIRAGKPVDPANLPLEPLEADEEEEEEKDAPMLQQQQEQEDEEVEAKEADAAVSAAAVAPAAAAAVDGRTPAQLLEELNRVTGELKAETQKRIDDVVLPHPYLYFVTGNTDRMTIADLKSALAAATRAAFVHAIVRVDQVMLLHQVTGEAQHIQKLYDDACADQRESQTDARMEHIRPLKVAMQRFIHTKALEVLQIDEATYDFLQTKCGSVAAQNGREIVDLAMTLVWLERAKSAGVATLRKTFETRRAMLTASIRAKQEAADAKAGEKKKKKEEEAATPEEEEEETKDDTAHTDKKPKAAQRLILSRW